MLVLWTPRVFFKQCPFKPLVESSSLSTLIKSSQLRGFFGLEGFKGMDFDPS